MVSHNVRGHRSKVRAVLMLSLVAIVMLSGMIAASRFLRSGEGSRVDPSIPRAVVRRTDLHATLRAPGQVDSSQSTLIECELEALWFATSGRGRVAGGASTIVEIVPDGTMVKEGDLLARLDSSEYEELVRSQTIEVERSRSDHRWAELDLEAQKIRLKEYRDGTLEQLREASLGRIAMAEAEFTRQTDRLDWTQRMVDLQYAPTSRLSLERQLLQQVSINLGNQRRSLANLNQYTAPKTIAQLEAGILAYQSLLGYFTLRLDQQMKQLERYQKQVENCTIRAPHDGFVIYANDDDDDSRIELGATVRQRQDLFRLPDLGNMEVHTLLHESIVDRVKPGQTATIQIEALPHARLEGRVVSVDPLPQSIRSWMGSNEVKNFVSRVQIDNIPAGLMPGMSAEVVLWTLDRPDAVVVPPQAVTTYEGHDVCYVTTDAGVERRQVELGGNTPDMIEVINGLVEGEQVVLHPSDYVTPELLVEAPAAPEPTQGESSPTKTLTAAATQPDRQPSL